MARWPKEMTLVLAMLLCGLATTPHSSHADKLDEMSLVRWAKLREAERYQLNVAEKYFREKSWKIAQAEYEKFLTLYERGEGAPYAQLKWSLCLVQQRKINTAIKDGFQSVIDYWPEAPEAVASKYFIARAYKDMGEIKKAKAAYARLLSEQPAHLAAVIAKVDLTELARIEGDDVQRVALWRELAFQVERNADRKAYCVQAAHQLAHRCFSKGDFSEGHKALASNYPPEQLPYHLVQFGHQGIRQLVAEPATRAQGEKLADAMIRFIEENLPTDWKEENLKRRARDYTFYIADIHGAAGRHDKVGAVYEQMLKTFGVDDDILGRLAGWFRGRNLRDEARRVYGRFQNTIEGQNQIAWMFREERRFDQAIAVYRELVTRDKDAGRWLWEIANTHRDAGQYREAIQAYRQCERFPQDLSEMAQCHRQLKEYREAIVLYQQILSTHQPSAAWALLQIAYTQEQAIQKENAIKTFQQVCKRYPKTGEASKAHAHLQDVYKINTTLGGAKDE